MRGLKEEGVKSLCQMLSPNAFPACSQANRPHIHYGGIEDFLESLFSPMNRLFLIT